MVLHNGDCAKEKMILYDEDNLLYTVKNRERDSYTLLEQDRNRGRLKKYASFSITSGFLPFRYQLNTMIWPKGRVINSRDHVIPSTIETFSALTESRARDTLEAHVLSVRDRLSDHLEDKEYSIVDKVFRTI